MGSSVAQPVEQVAVNHPVGGSSPSRGASEIKELGRCRLAPFSLREGTGVKKRCSSDAGYVGIAGAGFLSGIQRHQRIEKAALHFFVGKARLAVATAPQRRQG